MAVRGGATGDARVKLNEEGGHVMNGRSRRRWERSGGTNHCRGCIRNRNDNGRIVVKRMGNTNDWEWVVGSIGGRRDRGIRHMRGWRLNVLMLLSRQDASTADRPDKDGPCC